MKSRKPSLLSNSGPPRRAAALPKRPNCLLLTSVARRPEFRACLSRALPAEPIADRLSHDELLVPALQPRQFLGNIVTHCRYEHGIRVMSVPQKERCGT